jgi:hypothetical protein
LSYKAASFKVASFKAALAATTLLSMAASAPAAATKIVHVYTGTVKSGTDYAGLFGTPNTSLAGAAYTATFTIDDTTPGALHYDNNFVIPDRQSIGNGIKGDFAANPVSAVMTINGVDFALSNSTYGVAGQLRQYFSNKKYTFSVAGAEVQGDYDIPGYIGHVTTYLNSHIENWNGPLFPSDDYHTPYSYTTTNGPYLTQDQTRGLFSVFGIVTLPDIFGGGAPITSNFTSATAILEPRGVRTFVAVDTGTVSMAGAIRGGFGAISHPPAVPEPASWIMLIAGFGLVGAAMRWRGMAVVSA